MKSWSFIMAVAFLMLFTSSFSFAPMGNAEGNAAPRFELSKDGETVRLSDLEGKHVLVCFWSSANPESRIMNKKFSTMAQAMPADDFIYLAICTDKDTKLARQILKADGLSEDGQYFYDNDGNTNIADIFGVDHGSSVFLISPDGIIESVNIEPEDLISRLSFFMH